MTPGSTKKKTGQDLEEGAEQRTQAGLLLVAGGQHPLHDRLIAAPVPNADHGIAQQNAVPRLLAGIARATEHREEIRRGPVAAGLGVRSAGERMGTRGQGVGQFRPAADVVEAHRGDADGADEQEDRLDALGPHDGQQAAHHRVDPRQPRQDDDEEQHRVQAEDGRARLDAQHATEYQRRRVERHADVDHHGREDRDDRQPIAAVAIEAALEEIGQRGHPRAQVERREEERQQDQREPGHPLEVAVHHPVLVGRLRETDQVHRRDVGGEHRQADHRPAERVAGEEIVASLATPHAEPPGHTAQSHDGRQVHQNDRQVQRRKLGRYQGRTPS